MFKNHPKKLCKTDCQTVVNEIRREIWRCLKRDRDIGRKAVLSHVKTAFTCTPALTILVRLWVIAISLVFFYPTKLLFSGFRQSKDYFVNGWNTVIKIL